MDRQLRVVSLQDDSAAKSKGTRTASAQLIWLQDVGVDCLSIYAQVYRDTLTPQLIVAYQSCLAWLNPRFVHREFSRALKSSPFRPTPAECCKPTRGRSRMRQGRNRLRSHHWRKRSRSG